MEVQATPENLVLVRSAIAELVSGKRQVRVEYSTPDGYKNVFEYTSVSLQELRDLEHSITSTLNPVPVMQSIELELLF